MGVNSTVYYDKTNENDFSGASRVARPQSMLPWLTPYDKEGNEGESYLYLGTEVNTIKTRHEKSWNNSSTVSLVGSAYIELEPIRQLTLRSQAGLDGGFSYADYGRLPSHMWSIESGATATTACRASRPTTWSTRWSTNGS